MKKQSYLLIALATILSISCTASFNKNSFRSLGTMAITYDTALRSAADLHKRGFISEAGKQKIIEVANSYQRAHNNSVIAFQEYLTAPPETKDSAKQHFITLSRVAVSAYTELISILSANGIYGEPVEPWF
jgi:hypothetical protein